MGGAQIPISHPLGGRFVQAQVIIDSLSCLWSPWTFPYLIAEVHCAICVNVFCTIAAELGPQMAHFPKVSNITISLGIELEKDQVTMNMN